MGMDFADWLTLSLFLEATQRKTVPTVVAVIRADSSKMEIQAVGIGICEGRRPAESAGADVTQRAVMRVAEARSRVVACEERSHRVSDERIAGAVVGGKDSSGRGF